MVSPETKTSSHLALYLDGWFPGDMRDEEVHGNILTVDVLIYHVADGLGHHIGVQVCVVLQHMSKIHQL